MSAPSKWPSRGGNCARRSSGANISCERISMNWRNWNTCCRWRAARASRSVTGFSTTARARTASGSWRASKVWSSCAGKPGGSTPLASRLVGQAGGHSASLPASSRKTELRGQKEPLRGEKTNFEGTSLNGSNEVKTPLSPMKSMGLNNGPETSSDFPGNMYRKNGGTRPERSASYVR